MDTKLSAPIGQLLDGRYLVESQLARGGMATVYLGRDVRLDRAVALKIAHPELASDPEFSRRFIGEARAVARLSSPNVVAVFDQGATGDINYIAMEYVPGPTLRELLNARGRLSPREALDIIEGVLTGLAAAHDAGIIHRDVKPENVLLGTGSPVKVADFGLARAAAGMRNTKTGLLIGTAAYLAPEQVASSSSDQRSDVYAAGVMLFEMLTGSQPHTGDTPLAVAYKHVNAVVPAPSSLVPGLPSALDALVALATSRDPELRPPDASQYLQAISQVRHGMPLPAVRRGAHAAPDVPADDPVRPNNNQGGKGTTFSMATSARSSGAHAAPNSSDQANHTMIVPAAGAEAGFDDGGPYRARMRQPRGYREPFLQRWLFSRRIIAVLAVIFLAAGIWWLVSGQYTSVPRVAGMSVQAARADLAGAGFKVVVDKGRHSNVRAGHVIRTDPAAGAQIGQGGRVILIPSLGPVEAAVPNVSGMSVSDADQALRTAGFTPGATTYQASAGVQQGVVVTSVPVAYKMWPKDKPVALVISAGPPLPDFTNQQLAAAQAAAATGGYQISPEMVPNSSAPANTIISQSPAAGTPITSGEVVIVKVSAGPPTVMVPDIQGMSLHQAEKALQAAGFQYQVQGGTFSHTVTDYQPQGPQPQGSTITIIVGLGL